MQKRLRLFFSTMIVLSCVLTLTSAFAWTCAICGYDENTGDYCEICGEMKIEPSDIYSPEDIWPADGSEDEPQEPTPTPKAKEYAVTEIANLNNGYTRIAWGDPDDAGPYSLYYQSYVDDDFTSSDQSRMEKWLIEENVFDTYLTTFWLSPGKAYWIILTNSNGDESVIAYKPENPERFQEFGINIKAQLLSSIGTAKKEINSFSATTIKENLDMVGYGARIDLSYPRLAKKRNYLAHFVMTFPDGSTHTTLDIDFDLPFGKSKTYWRFYDFGDVFQVALDQYQRIPVGQYSWSIYFDGKYVNAFTFDVR